MERSEKALRKQFEPLVRRLESKIGLENGWMGVRELKTEAQ